MTNTEFVYNKNIKKNKDFEREFDERSVKLMVEYFLEDEEYKDLLDDFSTLSPSSLDLITYFLVIKDYH